MIPFIKHLLIDNWQRKLLALVSAIIIWFIVNNSITVTRTIPNIPVRIIHLSPDKTVEGLLPSGLLAKRITLTLSGSKQVLDELTPNDLQVVIDAENKNDQWIAKIDKRSLVSLNPEIDLSRNITEVAQNEFVIRLSRLVTEHVPIYITHPIGDPPPGYQFLDIWPQVLSQTISGPEKQVVQLQSKGLELTLDLNKITTKDLDSLQKQDHKEADEISFMVPDSWKQVAIPFLNNEEQLINDPQASQLRIDFLRRALLPLEIDLPVTIFFPMQYASILNPNSYSFQQNELVKEEYGLWTLKLPLFAKDVSKLFLDVVRNNLEIIIIAGPQNENKPLHWSLQFVNPLELENLYIAKAMAEGAGNATLSEEYLRVRFREYMHKLELFTSNGKKLKLNIEFENTKINITNANAS